jgi:hypothetical protein
MRPSSARPSGCPAEVTLLTAMEVDIRWAPERRRVGDDGVIASSNLTSRLFEQKCPVVFIVYSLWRGIAWGGQSQPLVVERGAAEVTIWHQRVVRHFAYRPPPGCLIQTLGIAAGHRVQYQHRLALFARFIVQN